MILNFKPNGERYLEGPVLRCKGQVSILKAPIVNNNLIRDGDNYQSRFHQNYRLPYSIINLLTPCLMKFESSMPIYKGSLITPAQSQLNQIPRIDNYYY